MSRIQDQGYGIFDFRFLNPLEKDTFQFGTTLGARYGYAQYILIITLIIAILTLILTGGSKGALVALFYFVAWFGIYFQVSCLFMPEGSQPCFMTTWLGTILPLIGATFTLITFALTARIMLNAFSGSIKGGNPVKDAAEWFTTGGNSCYKEKYEGGKKRKKEKKNKNGKKKKETQKPVIARAVDWWAPED